jgi:hypothetical protein
MLPYVRAQFGKDLAKFQAELSEFCTDGQHRFETEYHKARRASNRFSAIFDQVQQGVAADHVVNAFDAAMQATMTAIREIPADDDDLIIPAGSPFSAFLHIRALCASAVSRLDLFDPYLDSDSFHRYLAEASGSAVVTVVTDVHTMEPTSGNTRGLQRRDRIIAVSTVLAEQRPDHYRLLVVRALHDRHLRIDDRIYHLGGSVKDAGRSAAYSVTEMDPTPAIHGSLDAEISNAQRWFPDAQGEHRRA